MTIKKNVAKDDDSTGFGKDNPHSKHNRPVGRSLSDSTCTDSRHTEMSPSLLSPLPLINPRHGNRDIPASTPTISPTKVNQSPSMFHSSHHKNVFFGDNDATDTYLKLLPENDYLQLLPPSSPKPVELPSDCRSIHNSATPPYSLSSEGMCHADKVQLGRPTSHVKADSQPVRDDLDGDSYGYIVPDCEWQPDNRGCGQQHNRGTEGEGCKYVEETICKMETVPALGVVHRPIISNGEDNYNYVCELAELHVEGHNW